MSTKCSNVSTELVCYNDGTVNQTLVAHYEYRSAADGSLVLYATRYTEADGVTVVNTAGGTVTAGACALAAPDVEWERLCDTNTTTGVVTEFLRRSIVSFDSAGTPTVTVTDWALDKVTAYAPTGDVSACGDACEPVTTTLGVVTTWGV